MSSFSIPRGAVPYRSRLGWLPASLALNLILAGVMTLGLAFSSIGLPTAQANPPKAQHPGHHIHHHHHHHPHHRIHYVFYRMTVYDIHAGAQKIYFNYPGPPAPAVTDVTAFATCP